MQLTIAKSGYVSLRRPSLVVTCGSYTAADFALDPANPPLTFTPVADTYTSSTVPTGNYGTAATVRVALGTGTNPTLKTCLRFNVTGLTRPVQSAKVRLYVTNSSDQRPARST